MCDCITKMNEQLKSTGYQVVCGLGIRMADIDDGTHQSQIWSAPVIALEKRGDAVKTKAKPKPMARYCPACGERYIKLFDGEVVQTKEVSTDAT